MIDKKKERKMEINLKIAYQKPYTEGKNSVNKKTDKGIGVLSNKRESKSTANAGGRMNRTEVRMKGKGIVRLSDGRDRRDSHKEDKPNDKGEARLSDTRDRRDSHKEDKPNDKGEGKLSDPKERRDSRGEGRQSDKAEGKLSDTKEHRETQGEDKSDDKEEGRLSDKKEEEEKGKAKKKKHSQPPWKSGAMTKPNLQDEKQTECNCHSFREMLKYNQEKSKAAGGSGEKSVDDERYKSRRYWKKIFWDTNMIRMWIENVKKSLPYICEGCQDGYRELHKTIATHVLHGGIMPYQRNSKLQKNPFVKCMKIGECLLCGPPSIDNVPESRGITSYSAIKEKAEHIQRYLNQPCEENYITMNYKGTLAFKRSNSPALEDQSSNEHLSEISEIRHSLKYLADDSTVSSSELAVPLTEFHKERIRRKLRLPEDPIYLVGVWEIRSMTGVDKANGKEKEITHQEILHGNDPSPCQTCYKRVLLYENYTFIFKRTKKKKYINNVRIKCACSLDYKVLHPDVETRLLPYTTKSEMELFLKNSEHSLGGKEYNKVFDSVADRLKIAVNETRRRVADGSIDFSIRKLSWLNRIPRDSQRNSRVRCSNKPSRFRIGRFGGPFLVPSKYRRHPMEQQAVRLKGGPFLKISMDNDETNDSFLQSLPMQYMLPQDCAKVLKNKEEILKLIEKNVEQTFKKYVRKKANKVAKHLYHARNLKGSFLSPPPSSGSTTSSSPVITDTSETDIIRKIRVCAHKLHKRYPPCEKLRKKIEARKRKEKKKKKQKKSSSDGKTLQGNPMEQLTLLEVLRDYAESLQINMKRKKPELEVEQLKLKCYDHKKEELSYKLDDESKKLDEWIGEQIVKGDGSDRELPSEIPQYDEEEDAEAGLFCQDSMLQTILPPGLESMSASTLTLGIEDEEQLDSYLDEEGELPSIRTSEVSTSNAEGEVPSAKHSLKESEAGNGELDASQRKSSSRKSSQKDSVKPVRISVTKSNPEMVTEEGGVRDTEGEKEKKREQVQEKGGEQGLETDQEADLDQEISLDQYHEYEQDQELDGEGEGEEYEMLRSKRKRKTSLTKTVIETMIHTSSSEENAGRVQYLTVMLSKKIVEKAKQKSGTCICKVPDDAEEYLSDEDYIKWIHSHWKDGELLTRFELEDKIPVNFTEDMLALDIDLQKTKTSNEQKSTTSEDESLDDTNPTIDNLPDDNVQQVENLDVFERICSKILDNAPINIEQQHIGNACTDYSIYTVQTNFETSFTKLEHQEPLYEKRGQEIMKTQTGNLLKCLEYLTYLKDTGYIEMNQADCIDQTKVPHWYDDNGGENQIQNLWTKQFSLQYDEKLNFISNQSENLQLYFSRSVSKKSNFSNLRNPVGHIETNKDIKKTQVSKLVNKSNSLQSMGSFNNLNIQHNKSKTIQGKRKTTKTFYHHYRKTNKQTENGASERHLASESSSSSEECDRLKELLESSFNDAEMISLFAVLNAEQRNEVFCKLKKDESVKKSFLYQLRNAILRAIKIIRLPSRKIFVEKISEIKRALDCIEQGLAMTNKENEHIKMKQYSLFTYQYPLEAVYILPKEPVKYEDAAKIAVHILEYWCNIRMQYNKLFRLLRSDTFYEILSYTYQPKEESKMPAEPYQIPEELLNEKAEILVEIINFIRNYDDIEKRSQVCEQCVDTKKNIQTRRLKTLAFKMIDFMRTFYKYINRIHYPKEQDISQFLVPRFVEWEDITEPPEEKAKIKSSKKIFPPALYEFRANKLRVLTGKRMMEALAPPRVPVLYPVPYPRELKRMEKIYGKQIVSYLMPRYILPQQMPLKEVDKTKVLYPKLIAEPGPRTVQLLCPKIITIPVKPDDKSKDDKSSQKPFSRKFGTQLGKLNSILSKSQRKYNRNTEGKRGFTENSKGQMRQLQKILMLNGFLEFLRDKAIKPTEQITLKRAYTDSHILKDAARKSLRIKIGELMKTIKRTKIISKKENIPSRHTSAEELELMKEAFIRENGSSCTLKDLHKKNIIRKLISKKQLSPPSKTNQRKTTNTVPIYSTYASLFGKLPEKYVRKLKYSPKKSHSTKKNELKNLVQEDNLLISSSTDKSDASEVEETEIPICANGKRPVEKYGKPKVIVLQRLNTVTINIIKETNSEPVLISKCDLNIVKCGDEKIPSMFNRRATKTASKDLLINSITRKLPEEDKNLIITFLKPRNSRKISWKYIAKKKIKMTFVKKLAIWNKLSTLSNHINVRQTFKRALTRNEIKPKLREKHSVPLKVRKTSMGFGESNKMKKMFNKSVTLQNCYKGFTNYMLTEGLLQENLLWGKNFKEKPYYSSSETKTYTTNPEYSDDLDFMSLISTSALDEDENTSQTGNEEVQKKDAKSAKRSLKILWDFLD